MSDPTPEETARLIERLKQVATYNPPDAHQPLAVQAATAMESLQRRAETLERERDEARREAEHKHRLFIETSGEYDNETDALEEAESRLAALEKVVEAAQAVLVKFMPSFPDSRAVDDDLVTLAFALSQLAEKGGTKS